MPTSLVPQPIQARAREVPPGVLPRQEGARSLLGLRQEVLARLCAGWALFPGGFTDVQKGRERHQPGRGQEVANGKHSAPVVQGYEPPIRHAPRALGPHAQRQPAAGTMVAPQVQGPTGQHDAQRPVTKSPLASSAFDDEYDLLLPNPATILLCGLHAMPPTSQHGVASSVACVVPYLVRLHPAIRCQRPRRWHQAAER